MGNPLPKAGQGLWTIRYHFGRPPPGRLCMFHAQAGHRTRRRFI